jgi:hypothetical protein
MVPATRTLDLHGNGIILKRMVEKITLKLNVKFKSSNGWMSWICLEKRKWGIKQYNHRRG